MTIRWTILTAFPGLFVAAASAHHAFFPTYSEAELELKDVTIVGLNWLNPHTIVSFDLTDDTGNE